MLNKLCLFERDALTKPEKCSLWLKISISYNACRYSFVIVSVGFNSNREATRHTCTPKSVENCSDNDNDNEIILFRHKNKNNT